MHHKTYLLQGADLAEPVTRFVQHYWPDAYESTYDGGFLRAFEDYSWMNSNGILVCIRVSTLRAAEGEVEIEVIAGGARNSLIFDVGWGSENRRIARFEKELLPFCKANNINVEVVREG